MRPLSQLISQIRNRREQLAIQEKHDSTLTSMIPVCPNTVIDYIMLDRQFNRILSYRYTNINPFDILKITNENIEITQAELAKYTDQVCDCETLAEYNREFRERVFKYQTHSDT